MAAKRPIFAENFSVNLTGIQDFLGARGRHAYQRLLTGLFDEVVPTVCEFPLSGRAFVARSIGSAKGEALAKRLRSRLHKGDFVRELVVDEYLVLYLVRENHLVFLSIRHHRQLSFDLHRFWQEP